MPNPLHFIRKIIPESNRFASAILLASLTLPPLFFGSRSPVATALWCAVLGCGVLASSTRRLLRGHWWGLAAILAICGAYAAVMLLQLHAGPPWVMPDAIWRGASEALNVPLHGSASAVGGEPYFAIGPPLANLLALATGLIVGNNSERARTGLRCAAYAGALYGLYGVTAYIADPTHVLWYEKVQYIDSVTATFVNANTAASYFGASAVIWLVLLLDEVARQPSAQVQAAHRLQRFIARFSPTAAFRLAMLTLCLSALAMTNSRAGVLISVAVLGFTILMHRRNSLTPRRTILGLLGFAAGSLVLFVLLGGGVHRRVSVQGLFDDEGRFAVYRSMIEMIRQHPWLGTGLGTFPSAFPQYRNRDISAQLVWDLGHNTYLEFVSEAGIPLALLCAIAWIGAIAILLRSLFVRQHTSSVTLAALAVAVLALLHSAIDFSLQIGGFSIVVFALLGLGLSRSIHTLSGSPEPRRHR